jgi:hypothetical protein
MVYTCIIPACLYVYVFLGTYRQHSNCSILCKTIITAMSPNDSLLRRHPVGLTQSTPGHGHQYFLTPSLCPLTTRFRAPLRTCRRSLNRPPRAAGWGPRPNPRLLTRTQAPSQPIGKVVLLPETYSVCHSPPKTPPDCDWRMHVCAWICMYCMYIHVSVCICMYMYVLSV